MKRMARFRLEEWRRALAGYGLAAGCCPGIAATRQKSLRWKAAAWITKVHHSFVMIDMRFLWCYKVGQEVWNEEINLLSDL